jgi:hypothetical protein
VKEDVKPGPTPEVFAALCIPAPRRRCPRCPHTDGIRCATEVPSIAEDMTGRQVACHYASELDLLGIGQPAAAGAARRSDDVLRRGNN